MTEPEIGAERVDAEGRKVWNGGAWLLVEPSAQFLAERAAAEAADPGPPPDPVLAVINAVRGPLAALTSSSTAATTRTALLAARDALDELAASFEAES